MKEHKKYAKKLLKKKNVVSVGRGFKNGTDEECVVVGVTEKVPLESLKKKDRVPKKLGKVNTDVVQQGPFKALRRMRPARPGCSIGHKDITAGTMSCVVNRVGLPSMRLILSNNHVLANVNKAEIGDEILQPGVADGGTLPDDLIGTLEDFIEIKMMGLPSECSIANGFSNVINWFTDLFRSKSYVKALANEGTNLVDCALAFPVSVDDISTDILFDIGSPTGSAAPVLNGMIYKSGRTTGYSTGTVQQIEVTVQVQMDEMGSIAVFEDQCFSDIESAGGDSGSAILNRDNKVVGLLFAGGDGVTVFNDINNVLDALGIEITV